MKQKIILVFLFMMISSQSMAVLDHECQQNPLPPNIDCPDDEFFDQQWAADFMDFPYGWFYTHGTARVGIIDTYVKTTVENSKNLKMDYSGMFVSVKKEDDLVHLNAEGCETPGNINKEKLNDYEVTKGYKGLYQSDFSKYPSVFINEMFIRSNSNGFIEIAVKESVNIANITIDIKFHSHPVYNELTYLTDWNRFSNSDFGGYKFYYLNRRLVYGLTVLRDEAQVIIKLQNNIVLSEKNEESFQYTDCLRYYNRLMASPINASNHGSMVLSLLGSDSNNQTGMSSFCRDCNLTYGDYLNHKPIRDYSKFCNNSADPAFCLKKFARLNFEHAFKYSLQTGNQIINMSGGQIPDFELCDNQDSVYGSHMVFCDLINQANDRDVVFVAAAGNNLKNVMQWPASETSKVLAVAGTSRDGSLWERVTCPNSGNTNECGTNFDWGRTKFAAPADGILVNHPGGDYNAHVGCRDNNFGTPSDGYQRCSGTSFSAPILTSVVAMIRSVNPLISVDDIKTILWDARVPNLADQRYAIPQADKSVELALGISNGSQVLNRLTPMFRMKTQPMFNYPNQISYLSTTIPQVAVAARSGTYLVSPKKQTGQVHFTDKVAYRTDISSPIVRGYASFKGISETARAPFFVFAGHRNPFNNNVNDLLPLHHMVRDRFYGYQARCAELADHGYSTVRNNGLSTETFCSFYSINYKYEGIEGYILPNCPSGVDCYETTGNPNDAQCLKLRYSIQDNGFALMMESEINKTIFQSYGVSYRNKYNQLVSISTLQGMSNAECLGYVFPNVDSDNDGIIDGMELVLGTDPNNRDTDGDNYNDGYEYPLSGIPRSDPLTFDAGAPDCSKKEKGC